MKNYLKENTYQRNSRYQINSIATYSNTNLPQQKFEYSAMNFEINVIKKKQQFDKAIGSQNSVRLAKTSRQFFCRPYRFSTIQRNKYKLRKIINESFPEANKDIPFDAQ